MSLLASALDHPFVYRLGWVLLHSVWEGALVAVGYGLLRSWLRHRSANVRYLAGCCTLILLVAAPVATVLFGATAVTATTPARIINHSASVSSVMIANLATSSGGTSAVILRQAAEVLDAILPWLVAAWAIGVGIFSMRLLQGCWWVRRLRRNVIEPLNADWLERLADLKCRLNISRPVRLFKSALVEVPTVAGWLRPVILLPASCLTGLAPSQLEAILAHELAHICRQDYLVNALQNVVETLMFYHPAVWWISRFIREEREHCCDDLVVEVCGDRVAYARALAVLEERRGRVPQLAFAASGGSLLHRIRRLLGLPADPAETGWRQYAALALLGVGLMMIIAGIGLVLVPAKYEAAARIRLAPKYLPSPSHNDSNSSPQSPDYSASQVHTEVEVIRSRAVLDAVNAKLGLSETWGRETAAGKPLTGEEACQLLKQRIQIRPVSDTSLIEIQASSRDPKEAVELANAIAEVYRQYRLERNREDTVNWIKALEASWHEQRNKVDEAQRRVDKLRTDLKIFDPDPTSTAPTPTFSADTIRQLQAQLIAMEAEQVRLEVQLKRLRDLPPTELQGAIQAATGPDPELNNLLSEHDLATQNLLKITQNYATNHPAYVSAKAQVDHLTQKLNDRVKGLMIGLANRVESGRAAIDELKAKLDRAKQSDLEGAEKSRPYYEAKQQLAELLQFRTLLGMKIASAQTDLALPRSTPVEIVDRAVSPLRPVAPNPQRAAALIALGFVSSIAGVVMSRRKREPAAPS